MSPCQAPVSQSDFAIKEVEKPIRALIREIDNKLSDLLFGVIYNHERTISPILEQAPVCGEEKCCDKVEPTQLVDVLRDFSDRITQAIERIDSLTRRSQV